MNIMRMIVASVCVALFTGLAACGTMSGQACDASQRSMVAEYIYFGTNAPPRQVTPAEWNTFVSDVVSSLFPHGFTYWQATGQWRNERGVIIQERSYVLNVIREGNEKSDALIKEVVKSYKERFAQEAVLRASSHVCETH